MIGSISFIVPTIGRASLKQTLASIVTEPGDEIIVVGTPCDESDGRARYLRCPQGNHWGYEERTLGIAEARCEYLAFIDDDDAYVRPARVIQARALRNAPGRPILCRMRFPNGFTLWRDPALRIGNVSTAMILIPNDKTRLGRWTKRREGDFDFLASMGWPESAITWWPEVIVQCGHDDTGQSDELRAVPVALDDARLGDA